MTRFLFILSAVLALQTSAFGQFLQFRQARPVEQCPNGQCPNAQPQAQLQATPAFTFNAAKAATPAVSTVPAGPKAEGPSPGPGFEWKKLPPPVGWGWVQCPDAPAEPPSPAGPFGLGGAPAPKFNDTVRADYEPLHGRMFYRTVRDHWYHELVNKKGMDREKARQLVESLSKESIDAYGQHVGINISGGLGDGKFVDWIVAHKDQIIALIKLLMTLFAFADATDHSEPGYAWAQVDWHQALQLPL